VLVRSKQRLEQGADSLNGHVPKDSAAFPSALPWLVAFAGWVQSQEISKVRAR
jgi:hypothetical protein